jgi:hypothetical protein
MVMRIIRMVAAVVTAAIGASALASASAATAASAAKPAGAHASFSGVSCPSATFCLAVGSHLAPSGARRALAEKWNGTSWRVVAAPPGRVLDSVSCTGATFCMAEGVLNGAGAINLAETWNGHTWRIQKLPVFPVSRISCGSPRLCMLVTGRAADQTVVRYWNGRTWRISTGCDGGPLCSFSDVSCASASVCMAVGSVATDGSGDAFEGFTTTWNGKRWATGTDTFPANPVTSVTCARHLSFCLTVAGGTVSAWNPTRGWRDVTPGPGCGQCRVGPPFGCAGPAFCTSVLGFSVPMVAVDWRGGAWKKVTMAPPPARGHALYSVSCGSAASCMAAGVYYTRTQNWAFAEHWNGKTWRLSQTPVVG